MQGGCEAARGTSARVLFDVHSGTFLSAPSFHVRAFTQADTSAMPDGRVPALAIRPGKASVTMRCHARSDFRSTCVRLQRQRSQSATAGGKASTSKPLAVMSALRAPSAGPRSIVRPGSQGFFVQSQPSRFAALRASALSQSSTLILPDKKALRCASR